jgi:hypothetical protein
MQNRFMQKIAKTCSLPIAVSLKISGLRSHHRALYKLIGGYKFNDDVTVVLIG